MKIVIQVVNKIPCITLPHNATYSTVLPINCPIMSKALHFTTFINFVEKVAIPRYTSRCICFYLCYVQLLIKKSQRKYNYVSLDPFTAVCGCVRLYAVVLVCVRLCWFMYACVGLCTFLLVYVRLCWIVCACVVLP